MSATVLEGGVIADGSGTEAARLDVRFDTAGVREIGVGIARAGDRVVSAKGMVVMPGFIDTHVHAAALLGGGDSPVATEPLLAQGITTVILGGDGFAWCGGGAEDLAFTSEYFGGIDGATPHGVDGTVASLLEHYEGLPLNVGLLIPGNTVRHAVMGSTDAQPTPEQLEHMVELVRVGLADGALGLATGLEYVPGRFSSDDELSALCAAVSAVGGVHASHMRGYGTGVVEGVASLIRVQQHSGVKTHIAHLRAAAPVALAALTADITFDSYPYQRGCTLLGMKVLPPAVQTASVAESLNFVASSGSAAFFDNVDPALGNYVLSSSGSSGLSHHAGSTLDAIALKENLSLGALIRAVLIDSSLSATCIVPGERNQESEEDYAALLRDPRQMASSDGIYVGEHPHPRGWGAFARVLARHVRERGDLTLGQAAAHLAGNAASRFGLAGRGVIAVGNHADLVVVDAAQVMDRATYANPRTLARGIEHVYVNGVEVFAAGQSTGAQSGRALRRELRVAA